MRVKSSFSLFEILLVLSLILVVVTISVPARGFLGQFFLRSEIERLGVFYKYLQMRAMASGRQHALIFNLQDNSCCCQVSKSELLVYKLESGVRFGFIPGILGPPSKPAAMIDKSIILDKPIGMSANISDLCVNFYANGKITSGSIYFIDRQKKRMGALTCSPSRVSYLRRYICDGKNWVLL